MSFTYKYSDVDFNNEKKVFIYFEKEEADTPDEEEEEEILEANFSKEEIQSRKNSLIYKYYKKIVK